MATFVCIFFLYLDFYNIVLASSVYYLLNKCWFFWALSPKRATGLGFNYLNLAFLGSIKEIFFSHLVPIHNQKLDGIENQQMNFIHYGGKMNIYLIASMSNEPVYLN
jgi:hypothetical protein